MTVIIKEQKIRRKVLQGEQESEYPLQTSQNQVGLVTKWMENLPEQTKRKCWY